MREKPLIVIGSAQEHASVRSVLSWSPCVNAACGMGGGQTPLIVYECDEEEADGGPSR